MVDSDDNGNVSFFHHPVCTRATVGEVSARLELIKGICGNLKLVVEIASVD